MPEIRISLSEAAKQKQQKLHEALIQNKMEDMKDSNSSNKCIINIDLSTNKE